MQRLTRLVFWAATAFTLVMASLPTPPRLPGSPSDKVQHILAFLVLGALAASAYPRAPAWRIVIALSCFGALIEIVQAIPALHRDSSALDWMADTVAAALMLTAMTLLRSRSEARG